jgi:hypothetical protein
MLSALLSSHAVRIQSAVKFTPPRSMGGDPELPATERAQVYSRIRSESAPASRLSPLPSLSHTLLLPSEIRFPPSWHRRAIPRFSSVQFLF